jgi:hypothetical protein
MVLPGKLNIIYCCINRLTITQERLLFNRILHCTPDELLFECAESRFCECPEWPESVETHPHFSNKNWKTTFAKDSVTNDDWQQMISLYSRKELTYHKDILPALSGIANRLRDGPYHAGMWEKGLPQSLLWYSVIDKADGQEHWPSRPNSYTAPTFAWPSVVGSKEFMKLNHCSPQVAIKTVECVPKGDSPLGELGAGFIDLEGKFLDAVFVHGFEAPMQPQSFIEGTTEATLCLCATLKCERFGHFIFHPDTQEDLAPVRDTRLFCLQLFSSEDQQKIFGLVLRHPDEDPELGLKEAMKRDCVRLGIRIDQDESLLQLERYNKASLTKKEKLEREIAMEAILRNRKIMFELDQRIARLDSQYRRVGMFSSIGHNHFARAESQIFTII